LTVSPTELGEQEYAVWLVVQKLGHTSIRQVYDAAGAPRGLAYTTIATVLDRLFAKGVVERERTGRSFVYWAPRRAPPTKRVRARTLIARVLGSNPEPAISTLVDAVEAIDPALLDRLAEEIAARRRNRRDS